MLAVVACHHTRKTVTDDLPKNGDPVAQKRFLEAQSRFLRDGKDGEFAKIVEEYPTDPIAPWAELGAGIAAIKARDFAAADAQLTKAVAAQAPERLTARARMFLGIAKNYEGQAANALQLLAHTPDSAFENDDDRTEYVAAVAYAFAASDRPLDSLKWFDELYDRVTPAERALIVMRCEEVAAGVADKSALERAYDELQNRKGPGISALGARLVAIADQTGDAARAAKLRTDLAPVRERLGLPKTIAVGETPAGGGQAGLIGAIVPLSGVQNRIGEAAAAGLALAAGAPDGQGIAAVETRDAPDPTAAQEAVDQLAKQNVIAIVGPIDKKSVDAATARAGSLGVPLISLSTTPEQRATGPFVFHVRHSPEARARMLAQRAIAAGVKRFLVLAPNSPYGKGVGDAFADAVRKAGGTIVDTKTYAANAKSYAWKPGSLGDTWQGVFVPDDADKLALVAPALAAAGYIPKPPGTKGNKKTLGGTPVLLLSTADGLAGGYLSEAGRHSEGAFLAPGFYPDDADPNAKPFIDRFVAAYGRAPSATEAYAYDAAQLAAAAGSGNRSKLAATLGNAQLAGVTGAIKFDADHRRADPGNVYTVVEETGGTWAIRALR